MINGPESIDPTQSPLCDRYPATTFPNRTDIVYRDNASYNRSITNLPWGAVAFTVKRYRISASQSLDLAEQSTANGPSLTLPNLLCVDTVEVIVLERK
jgi:hypothetical protein